MLLLSRKPVYVDRNVPWRRFGGSVSDLLVSEGLSALPQLPPASPLGIGVGVTALSDSRFPPAPSPTSFEASASVWCLDATGTQAAAFVQPGAAPAALRPSARPAAAAPFQLDGVYARRRTQHPARILQHGAVRSALPPSVVASLLAL